MRELIVYLPGNTFITPIHPDEEGSWDQMLKDAVANPQPHLLEINGSDSKGRVRSSAVLGWRFRDGDSAKERQQQRQFTQTAQVMMDKIGKSLDASDDADRWKRGEG